MTGVTQLGYLGIGVRDVDEWERFATGILGLQANGRSSDGSLFLRMDEYHHRFVIQPNGNDDVAYIGWQATNEGSMQEIAERLNAAGVEVTQQRIQGMDNSKLVPLLVGALQEAVAKIEVLETKVTVLEG